MSGERAACEFCGVSIRLVHVPVDEHRTIPMWCDIAGDCLCGGGQPPDYQTHEPAPGAKQ